MANVVNFVLIFLCVMILQEGNPISENVTIICVNEFPSSFCDKLVHADSCRSLSEESLLRGGCKKSCGFCEEGSAGGDNPVRADDPPVTSEHQVRDDDEDGIGGNKCEDKMPDCSKHISLCCAMKEAMNISCQKTCKFCSETPAATLAPGVGGGGQPVPTPTGSTSQDPCNPTNPPSATVDVPGQTTSTTLSPVVSAIPTNPVG